MNTDKQLKFRNTARRGAKWLERGVEGLFTASGWVSIVIVLLITIFLFKEGFGLFQSPTVEKGYVLCVHPSNPVERLNASQIKHIFDYETTSWSEVGGADLEIRPFRFEEIFDYYAEEEFGPDYEFLPDKLAEVVAGDEGILAIMALPTIITVAEDAMRNTPLAMREASLSLGATQWQTIYRVVIPYASSGISAAIVLGIGRAVGETMAVLMVTGNAAVMPTSLFEPIRTIPATIAAELGEAPAGGAHYQSLFLLGCILFLITLVISVSAELISKKQRQAV